MHQRLLAVALLFSVCAPSVHSLRVYSHVYKKSGKKWSWGQAGVVNEALEKLERQWPGGEKSKEMLSAAMIGHDLFDGDVLRQKLSKKMHAQEPFIFATFGSSVSAGHDNFANHSWVFELERILKPTFQALNFDIEMRQRAMGGYGSTPYHGGCLAERAGPGEIDAVAWEFGMFHDPECELSMFSRDVAAMDSKPALIAFQSTDLNCRWGCEREDEEARGKLRNEVLTLKDEEGWHWTWHDNDWFFSEEFISNDEAKNYHNLAKAHLKGSKATSSMPDAMRNWAMARLAKAQNVEGFYGVNPQVAAGFVSDEPWYTAREKAFHINWHPGPLGHKLLASQVAHFMLTELKKELEGVSLSVRVKAPGAGPTADNPLLGHGEKAVDDKCGTMVTQTCRSGLEPTSRGLSAWESLNSQHTWEFIRDPAVTVGGRLGKQIDGRNVWRGNQSSGELQFEVEVPEGEGQHLLVCSKPCGWWCEDLTGYVSTKSQRWWGDRMPTFEKGVPRKDVSDLEFKVDGSIVAPDELLRLHHELFDSQEGKYCPGCEGSADVCQPAGKLSPGKHTIGLNVKPSSYNDAKMHVDILQYMLVA